MTTTLATPDYTKVHNKVMSQFFENLQNKYAYDIQKTTPAHESTIGFLWHTWEAFAVSLPIALTLPAYSLTQTVPEMPAIYEYCNALFNREVQEFCIQHGLLAAANRYHCLIKNTFCNIQSISPSIIHDPEIEDYTKLRFLVSLSGTVEQVFEQEIVFKKRVREEIDQELRQYFLLRCQFA